MAETLEIDLGLTILAGLGAGVLPAIAVLITSNRMNSKFDIPVRVAFESNDDEEGQPSLLVSVLPVVAPIVLISLASITEVMLGSTPAWMAFWGNKNIAMAVGTTLALMLWLKQRKLNASQLWKEVAKPLEIAGVIILITSAGGAFGAMIKHSGIGAAIEIGTQNFHISYIILAWLIAAVMNSRG